jgi:hypothetical protein
MPSDFTAPVMVKVRPYVGSAAYERKRLMAASRLWVKRTDDPNEYIVQSRSHPDTPRAVKLDGDPMCYCEDNEMTTPQCSHVLAARLARGDMPLVQALGNMLYEAQERSKELERTHRRRSRRKSAALGAKDDERRGA